MDTNSKLAYGKLQCQQMGEYCFDPQIGLYKRGEEGKALEEVDMAEVENSKAYDFMDPHKGHERDLIECDENSNFFDIFCGKAKKISAQGKSKLEVWVDVSSTLKQVDFNGYAKPCARETFLKTLAGTCPLNQKMKVYYFEEFKKEAGALDRVCISGGLNNMKNILRDLKQSKADHVIIITDIFEAEDSFITGIEVMGKNTIKGLDKPFYAKDLKSELKRVQTICK